MRPRPTYANVVATIALFVALGGTAIATHPGGQNTISTADIQNGEVKVADVGQGAVATDELANNQVKAADIGDGEVKTAELANGQVKTADIGGGEVRSSNVLNETLTGGDVATNSLKGADIDEATLDVGDAARAYAVVDHASCTGTPGTCTPEQSKGISGVTRDGTGFYCVTAPGIDANVTPAAVTVEWFRTNHPEGNASAMTEESGGCGPGGEGFRVITQRQPNVTVDAGGGVNNATAVGPAVPDNNVGFTIVIP
ncbi:MAG: hypothetical protein ACRDLO_07375 [Solirubrobacterales bacterium]